MKTAEISFGSKITDIYVYSMLPVYVNTQLPMYHVNTQLGIGSHWWFNYPDPLLNVELEFACLSR